jgi:hypothetical protein
MLNWLFGKKLETVLAETKTVKVKGVIFRIKKINALDYMIGYQVIKQVFDVYKTNKEVKDEDVNFKKIKEAMEHALVSAVVFPQLSLKDEPGKIHIEKLFSDWEMVNLLYQEIIDYAYGKKKTNKFILYVKKLLK